ncbi:MAG: large-conductance mechanosensitive channel protein MscL [Pirellulales bacterium]
MGFFKEFRDFAMRGNVVDLAVGLIIGAEFGKIVNSLVNDIIMPPIGMAINGVNFSELKYSLGQTAVMKDGAPVLKNGAPEVKEAFLNYGQFIQTTLNFVIIAFCVFLIVKAMNKAKELTSKNDAAAPPPEAPADIKLLAEIRDLLKERPVR